MAFNGSDMIYLNFEKNKNGSFVCDHDCVRYEISAINYDNDNLYCAFAFLYSHYRVLFLSNCLAECMEFCNNYVNRTEELKFHMVEHENGCQFYYFANYFQNNFVIDVTQDFNYNVEVFDSVKKESEILFIGNDFDTCKKVCNNYAFNKLQFYQSDIDKETNVSTLVAINRDSMYFVNVDLDDETNCMAYFLPCDSSKEFVDQQLLSSGNRKDCISACNKHAFGV